MGLTASDSASRTEKGVRRSVIMSRTGHGVGFEVTLKHFESGDDELHLNRSLSLFSRIFRISVNVSLH